MLIEITIKRLKLLKYHGQFVVEVSVKMGKNMKI